MAFKNMSTSTIIIGIIIISICAVGIIYAATNFQQEVNWDNPAETDFTVYTSLTGTGLATPTIDLTTPPAEPTILNYYIQNDGDVPITVTATVTFNSGSAVATLNPVSGAVTVAVGTTRQLITLQLSSFSIGTGQATVDFTSAEAI